MRNSAYVKGGDLPELVHLFKALSDETRLRVLNLLLERECCVCEVMQALDIPQPRASRALKALYEAGVLHLKKEGSWALYSIEKEDQRGYLSGLVRAVAEALKANQKIEADRERLKKTERIGPGATECMRQASN